jgi:TonB family protein
MARRSEEEIGGMRWRTWIVCLLAWLAATDAMGAQSLAELARQEEARRKAVAAPAPIITDKDLRPVPGSSPSALPVAPSPEVIAPKEDIERRFAAAAQYSGGGLPAIPVQAVNGGEVFLEVAVSREGRVAAIRVLRDTPPFTAALTASVRTWQFHPAEDEAIPKAGEPVDLTTRKAVESKVLVVAMFRPPALYADTLGEPPRDVAVASDEIPLPVGRVSMPVYAPLALFDGVVLAELQIGVDGHLLEATVLRSAPPFDQAALDALDQWSFRPARIRGQPVETRAYAVLAFRPPVSTPVAAGAPPSGN